jgi:hypothetical protein
MTSCPADRGGISGDPVAWSLDPVDAWLLENDLAVVTADRTIIDKRLDAMHSEKAVQGLRARDLALPKLVLGPAAG